MFWGVVAVLLNEGELDDVGGLWRKGRENASEDGISGMVTISLNRLWLGKVIKQT